MAGWWLTGSLADGITDWPRAVLVAVRADNGAGDSGVCSELLLTELRRLADTDSCCRRSCHPAEPTPAGPQRLCRHPRPCGPSAEAR